MYNFTKTKKKVFKKISPLKWQWQLLGGSPPLQCVIVTSSFMEKFFFGSSRYHRLGRGVLFGLVFVGGDTFPFRITLLALSYASKWSRKSSGMTGLRSTLFMYAVLFGDLDALVVFLGGGERSLCLLGTVDCSALMAIKSGLVLPLTLQRLRS